LRRPKVKPRTERALARRFPELRIGGFSRFDGAMHFYGFVNALLRSNMTVLDFGAGRGGLLEYTEAPYRTRYATIRGKVANVIGVDIDPIVKQNPLIDEAIVIDQSGHIPIDDCSVDLIVSVSTFEHIEDPAPVERELFRVLKPGGWVCVHTPNKYGYVAIGARLVPNALHKRILRWMQPQRPSLDVFPTVYKLNTQSAIKRYFKPKDWEVIIFPWSNEPCYMEDNRLAVWLLSLAGKYMPGPLQSHWSIFLQKKAG
jgi:SAM-dependent methyltransferase